jgi:hypothetical protein
MVLRVQGHIPPESWNRVGTKLLTKLRSGSNLKVGVDFSVTVEARAGKALSEALEQILADLGLTNEVVVSDE